MTTVNLNVSSEFAQTSRLK